LRALQQQKRRLAAKVIGKTGDRTLPELAFRSSTITRHMACHHRRYDRVTGSATR